MRKLPELLCPGPIRIKVLIPLIVTHETQNLTFTVLRLQTADLIDPSDSRGSFEEAEHRCVHSS